MDTIVSAIICLHNFLKTKDEDENPPTILYAPPAFVDRDQGGGVVNRGLNRQIDCGALQNMPPARIENVQSALDVRNTLKNYFLTAEGQVPWQYEYIQTGYFANE